MMSGGDLDGDQFFVCWDKKLLREPIRIHEPANYSKNSVRTDKPSENMTSIADHFVFYLERDVLGKLSNTWLALCD